MFTEVKMRKKIVALRNIFTAKRTSCTCCGCGGPSG